MLTYWLIVTHPQWHKDIQAETRIKKKVLLSCGILKVKEVAKKDQMS